MNEQSNQSSPPPMSWIKEIEKTLIDMKAIPLYENIPPFDWDIASRKLAEAFSLPGFKIYPKETIARTCAEFRAGFGADSLVLAIEIHPIGCKAYFLFGKEEIAKLTSFLLLREKKSPLDHLFFSSNSLQEGFYYFAIQKALHAINSFYPFHDLSLKMATFHSLAQEDALSIDIALTLPNEDYQTLWGRLICPEPTLSQLKAHFANRPYPALSSTIKEQLDLSLSLIVGKTSLSLAQFKEMKVGDFLLLDHCTFDPKNHKGTLSLHLEETPLFRLRMKDNGFKITDYALYYEEAKVMSPDLPEEDLFDHQEEQEEEVSLEEGEHLWSTPQEEEHEKLKKIISSSEIPLTITVEVDRIRMKLKELLELSPGNILELSSRPEKGVDLTIGGKKVAKGELIQLGDLIGVKILQMGD